MRRSERIEKLPEIKYDPERFEIPVAPGIPQLLTAEKYVSLLNYFIQPAGDAESFYPKEPLKFELRDTLCVKCRVFQKNNVLDSNQICKNQKNCNPLKLANIPLSISNLSEDEKRSLRILKIYAKRNPVNSYKYERFMGTSKLSVNWLVWKTCGGLIGRNTSYSKTSSHWKIGSRRAMSALQYLLNNNRLYKDLEYPKESLEFFWKQKNNVFGDSKGEVFTTLRKIDQTYYGKDDSNKKVLPVGELVSNGVKQVVSLAYKDIDAHLFPYLYPNGEGHIPNNKSDRALTVRNRLFNKDSRFRDCTDWMFYHFDTMEKLRLVDNNARTTMSKSDSSSYSKESVLSSSKYDFRTIFNDATTTTVPIGIRGSAAHFRKIRGDLFQFIKDFGIPQLFLTFSCDDENWPGLKEYLTRIGVSKLEVRENPVLANHYCYERLQGMMSHIVKNGYMGKKVKHHFRRFEFQQRGTVHMHALIWLETDNVADLVSGVSAELPSYQSDPFLHLLVRRFQVHRCSQYCGGNSGKCRFDFPKPLSNQTYFDPELKRFFIKRQTKDEYVNCYYPPWLKIWRGNMDIKIVNNTNVCRYITKYCTKEEPFNVEEEIVNYAKQYLETRDYSTHEIAHYCMGHHATEFSTSVVRINLAEEDLNKRFFKRVKDVKTAKDGPDMFFDNWVDKYENRPDELTNENIIDFFRNYYCVKAKGDGCLEDRKGKIWKKRKKECVVRVYPYYNEYSGDDYYSQLILKSTPFRSARELLDSIEDYRSYVAIHLLGKVQELNEFNTTFEEDLFDTDNYTDEDFQKIKNMYCIDRSTFKVKPSQLNNEQYNVFRAIMNQKRYLSRFHIIDGGPGTGKSFLLKALKNAYNAQGKDCAVTASTGVASFLVGGTTVHSKLLLRYFDAQQGWKTLLFDNNNYQTLMKVSVLIIDEFSMLGSGIFNKIMQIVTDERLNHIQVILIGDRFQLPPVCDSPFFNSKLSHEYFNLFVKHTLTINERQKENKLSEIISGFYDTNIPFNERVGKLLSFINSRLTKDRASQDSAYVYPYNNSCKTHNISILHSLNQPISEISFKAKFQVKSYFDLPLKSSIRNTFRMDPELQICVGARVLLLFNLDLSIGLANGSIGIIRDIEHGMKGSKVTVEFITKDGTTKIILNPMKEVHDDYVLHQFPIKLAYATSVHKVQGMTLKSIVVGDIRKFWCSQQLYVALSRVRNPEDIHFIQPDDRPDGFTLADLAETQTNNGKIADSTMQYGIKFYYEESNNENYQEINEDLLPW